MQRCFPWLQNMPVNNKDSDMKTYLLTLLQGFVVLLFPLLSGSRSPTTFWAIVIVGMILFLLALPLLLVVVMLGYGLQTIKQILFYKEETNV